MGMFDRVALNKTIIDHFNQYTGNQICDTEVFQTTITDTLAWYTIYEDFTISTAMGEIPDGIYELRYYCGNSIYFRLEDNTITHFIYGYKFCRSGWESDQSIEHPMVWSVSYDKGKGHGYWFPIKQTELSSLLHRCNNEYFGITDIDISKPPLTRLIDMIGHRQWYNVKTLLSHIAFCRHVEYFIHHHSCSDPFDILEDLNNQQVTEGHYAIMDKFVGNSISTKQQMLDAVIKTRRALGETVEDVVGVNNMQKFNLLVAELNQL